jgi:hypothetical protein
MAGGFIGCCWCGLRGEPNRNILLLNGLFDCFHLIFLVAVKLTSNRQPVLPTDAKKLFRFEVSLGVDDLRRGLPDISPKYSGYIITCKPQNIV